MNQNFLPELTNDSSSSLYVVGLLDKNISVIIENYSKEQGLRHQLCNYLTKTFECCSAKIHLTESLEKLWHSPAFSEQLQYLPSVFIVKVIKTYIINVNSEEKFEIIDFLQNILQFRDSNGIEQIFREIQQLIREMRDPGKKWSLIPTKEQLTCDQNNDLVVNQDNYKTLEEYLNIHFQLLKEEFVGHIRKMIKELNTSLEQPKHFCNIFSEVILESVNRSSSGSSYSIRVNRKVLTEKKLTFGSLVCISQSEDFREFYIGIITNRNRNDFENGVVGITFDRDLDMDMAFEKFILIESRAFYDCYKHLLDSILTTRINGHCAFPLFSPLVNGVYQQEIPAYLRAHTFNFDTITNLDQIQIEAIKFIMSNKVALIQGPSGTGKTFVGVRFIELLLKNFERLFHSSSVPIVIVTQTNNALDQFLEKILDSKLDLKYGRLVRLGNRSKSEKLNDYYLKSIRKTKIKKKSINDIIINQMKQSKQKLINIEHDVNQESYIINTAYEHLVKSKFILGELADFEKNSFNVENDEEMLDAIGFFDMANVSRYVVVMLIKANMFQETMEVQSSGQKRKGMDDNETEDYNEENLEEFENELEEVEYDTKIELDEAKIKIDQTFLANFISDDEIKKMSKRSSHNSTSQPISDTTLKRLKSFLLRISSLSYQQLHEMYICKCKKPKPKCNKTKSSCILTAAFKKYKQGNIKNPDSNINLNHAVFCHDCYKIIYDENRFFHMRLYLHGLSCYLDRINKQYDVNVEKQSFLLKKHMELINFADFEILKYAKVIGMTTSCAGRYNRLLKDLGPKVLVVEEAAHVLEAHIIAALTPAIEHLVLIGDHIQMGPLVLLYHLASKYKMNISMFERLINNNCNRIVLNCQHRINSSISWVYNHFYTKQIHDHVSVTSPVKLNGLVSNIYFINHNEPESTSLESSKKNKHEVNYITKFCLYLIKNDIRNITVMTMYLGQKDELKKCLSKCSTHLNRVDSIINVVTVDDYQGEENDIIILSLVSSDKIGFLKEKTRTCVAMTRARLGMFVIGNLEFLAEASDVWANLIQEAKDRQIYGNGIPLTCHKHPDNNIVARTGKDSEGEEFNDFDKRPDGGCQIACGRGLRCGHTCPKKCHSDDDSHTIVKCTKVCSKDVNCAFNQQNEIKHKCKQTCGHEGDCNICLEKIPKHMSECGNDIMFACSKEPKKSDCLSNCKKNFSVRT